MVCVRRSEAAFVELVPSFHIYVGSRDLTQVNNLSTEPNNRK